jgi:hypothetical protein
MYFGSSFLSRVRFFRLGRTGMVNTLAMYESGQFESLLSIPS